MKSAICLSAFVAAVISVCPPGNKEPRGSASDKKQRFKKERKQTLSSVVTGWKCGLRVTFLVMDTWQRAHLYGSFKNIPSHIKYSTITLWGDTRPEYECYQSRSGRYTKEVLIYISLCKWANEIWKWNQWIIIPENLKYLTWAAPACALPISRF